MLVTIIWPVRCLISTRVGVIMWTSCAKLIRESQEEHSFCLLALMSIILSLDWRGLSPTALNPFFLQWGCNKTCEPIRVFHVLRPNEVARYFPSAINEYSELACCWWQWTWADDQSSYRGRSWRRVCSSKVMGISNAPELGIVMEGSLKNKNYIFNFPLLISVISRVSVRRQIVNFVPSIFMASVHPPSPHPKFPRWQ